ncbi:hypothetical protein SMD44_06985 [Streptomyces alboflavus]|uniref:Uncharacterized protein n=1 Tax=Streptomyces alboflavus TaxID=67267 RepID=A0A1Z1WM38_9ACTN|nr:hypothetical protein SMD44_06985 [Streptomyces alboflavus]
MDADLRRAARVPGRVGEALLDDAVHALFQGRGQGPLAPGHRQLDGQPGRARALDEQGGAAGGPVGAQDLQGGAQLPHGLAAGLLDGEQRGRHLLAALARQVDGDSRLELDDGDLVGEGVVQFTGDAQALLAGPAQRHLLTGPLGLQGALLGLAQIRLPGRGRDAGGDGTHEPAGEQQGPLDGAVASRVGGEEHGEEGESGARGEQPVSAVGGGVHGAEDGEGRRGGRFGVQGEGGHGGGADEEDDARRAPVLGEDERADAHEGVVDGVRAALVHRGAHDDRGDGRGEHHEHRSGPALIEVAVAVEQATATWSSAFPHHVPHPSPGL